MDIKNVMGNVFYYGFFWILPVVGYYLKNKYTTIEVMGMQFSTMVTVFPVYFILTAIIIFVSNKKRDSLQKDS